MPMDRGQIESQLREIGEGDAWWEVREFRDLPHVLQSGERIRCLLQGTLHGARRPRLRRQKPWLLVVTTERLVCLRQDRLGRQHLDLVPGAVTRVDLGSRFRRYQVTLHTARGSYRLRIARADTARFLTALAPLLPELLGPRLNPEVGMLPGPELGVLAAIPGMTTVARLPGFSGVISRVALLSPPEPPTGAGELARLGAAVEALQEEVERLREQVGFLEELLARREGAGVLPAGED
jgi:hypothetical protein